MNELLGRRIKAAREEKGFTQAQLSELLGFKDRQTVAAIETGNRNLKAEELLSAMRGLGQDLDYFTDRFRPAGGGRRHFDLAHECFHVLTWESMPPERTEAVEGRYSGKGRHKRIEQLADNFAGALLMPKSLVNDRWQEPKEKDIPK